MARSTAIPISTRQPLLALTFQLVTMRSFFSPARLPASKMIGALYRYMSEADPKHFQPMNANFGLLDELPQRVRDKKQKREMFAGRALAEMQQWIDANGVHEVAAVEQLSNDRKAVEDISTKFAESISLAAPR